MFDLRHVFCATLEDVNKDDGAGNNARFVLLVLILLAMISFLCIFWCKFGVLAC
jgi:hypothetical protein